jgi:hypothetical protein
MSIVKFYDLPPQTEGLERLDIRDDEIAEDWFRVADLVQSDLMTLDPSIRESLPEMRVQYGTNRGGGAHLFVYRAYDAGPAVAIDPVVVGITISPDVGGEDRYKISGDIAGEGLGDILFEAPMRNVIGWESMLSAARDTSDKLAIQVERIGRALRDPSRQE